MSPRAIYRDARPDLTTTRSYRPTSFHPTHFPNTLPPILPIETKHPSQCLLDDWTRVQSLLAPFATLVQ
jgi:hypothetical protein